MITVIGAAEAIEGIGAHLSRMQNLKPLFIALGEWQMDNTMTRIENTKMSQYGALWEPWSVRRARERKEKGNVDLGLLHDTGALLGSFSYEATRDGVEIGTDISYAPMLQFGTDSMLPRPFMPDEEFGGLPEEDIVHLEFLSNLYMQGSSYA